MERVKCPDCGAKRFFVKDLEDQFNTSTFNLENGKMEYSDEGTGANHIPVSEDTEIFCERCAWHDTFKILIK
jgi:DNA-directed RNA polymerase subunit RPC12/RpoP